LRFTLIKNVKRDKAMKPILNALLLFILLYIPFDIFVKSHTIGISTVTLISTLYGNADEFIDPINQSVFLEFIHMQIFFLMMILLTLSAIYIRLLSHKSNTLLAINLLMGFAFVTPLTLFLSYFYTNEFVKIYLFSFFAWHLIALFITLRSLWELNFVK